MFGAEQNRSSASASPRREVAPVTDARFVTTFALLFVVYAALLVTHAWMVDDAYITLRTVDNFVNGFGLRWNSDERVQVYTHPLWMFACAAVYAVTHEAFYTVLVLLLVTRGPLVSMDRLIAIWRLNTGYYDHDLRAYASRHDLR